MSLLRNSLILIYLLSIVLISHGQSSKLDDADAFLASNFQVFTSIDTELGYCMGTVLEKRVIEQLKKPESFLYPYKRLSKYISIIHSEDSLFKIYSWDRRGGGSAHETAAYAQYKTSTGDVYYQRISPDPQHYSEEEIDASFYAIYRLKSPQNTYYLLLGSGTYGGGQHHCLAKVYKINGEMLVACNSFFGGEKHLYLCANRIDKIELKFDPKSKILSYNYYKFDEDRGFYHREGKKVFWKFQTDQFVKQN